MRPETRGRAILDIQREVGLSWTKNTQSGNIILTAQKFAVDLVKERALELGRQERLEDPWDCSEEQAPRDRATKHVAKHTVV